jgi:hypothetical protein
VDVYAVIVDTLVEWKVLQRVTDDDSDPGDD